MARCNKILLAMAFLIFSGTAQADFLVLTANYNSTPIWGTFNGSYTYVAGGGNLTGATLNGNSLANVYCVEWWQPVYVPGNYDATVVTSNALMHPGTSQQYTVTKAGEISWLLNNVAPNLGNDASLQAGLQAAIWYLASPSFGNNFSLDTTPGNNSSAVINAYLSDLSLAAVNSEALSDVDWMSPYFSGSSNNYQGLITPTGSPPPPGYSTPEPASVTMLAIGVACVAGYSWRRRKLAV